MAAITDLEMAIDKAKQNGMAVVTLDFRSYLLGMQHYQPLLTYAEEGRADVFADVAMVQLADGCVREEFAKGSFEWNTNPFDQASSEGPEAEWWTSRSFDVSDLCAPDVPDPLFDEAPSKDGEPAPSGGIDFGRHDRI